MSYRSKEVGKRIFTARVQAGETQADLAAALGVKREMIAYWETGVRPIKAEMLNEIADRYKVSVDYLLGLSDVQTLDKSVASAVDVTGLTETAINNICKSGCAEMLSRLLENESFISMLKDIEHFEYSVNKCKTSYSEIKRGIEQGYDHTRGYLGMNIEDIYRDKSEHDSNSWNLSIKYQEYKTEFSLMRLSEKDIVDKFTSVIAQITDCCDVIHDGKDLIRMEENKDGERG